MKAVMKIGFCLWMALCSMNVETAFAQGKTKYKCMVQMTNYMGESAYIVDPTLPGLERNLAALDDG
jgi:hypothetical protein